MARTGYAPGVFGATRRAWARAFVNQAILHTYPPRHAELPGKSVELTITVPHGKVQIKLSELSVDELTCLKGVCDLAFAEAYHVCAERDRVAQQEFDEGTREHSRMFRDPPVIWTREGELFDPVGRHLVTEWEGPNPQDFVRLRESNRAADPQLNPQDLDEDTSFNDEPSED